MLVGRDSDGFLMCFSVAFGFAHLAMIPGA